jgi:hypothetical protein
MTKVTNDQNIQGWSAADFETLDSFGEFGDVDSCNRSENKY